MKKIIKISGTIAGCVIFVSVLAIVIWYKKNQPLVFNNNKYFDLCVADVFFKDRTNQEYAPRTNERIQIKWDIPVEQFWNNDTITISITNTTGEKLYHFGCMYPLNNLVFEDYIIAPQGIVDTLYYHERTFSGIDDAEYIPFKKKKSFTLKSYNPLLQYPGYQPLPMDTEEFPQIIKDVYGDTTQIRYFVFLRGLPWNNHGFSIAYSDFIKIPVDSIIDGWKKNKFSTWHSSYNPENHQEYLDFYREDKMRREQDLDASL